MDARGTSLLKPRRGRPPNRDADAAILDTAKTLLFEVGYRGLTLDLVAARAKVSKATIYRHWASKEKLAIAALAAMSPIVAHDVGNVVEELAEVLLQFIALVESGPSVMHAETRIIATLPSLLADCAGESPLAAALNDFVERRRRPVKVILRRAIRRGDLPPSIDIEMAVDAIMGPVVVRLFYTRRPTNERDVRRLLGIILTGLGATQQK